MGTTNIIALLSGVALFLFGMTLMGEGLKKVAGSRLELILYRLSSTPLKGILLGTGVTAVIQSSSATSVMVVGFVNSGMMKVRQAIGIILGAILGTSVTGWVLCLSAISGAGGWTELLSTATLSGIVSVIGIILRMFCKKPTQKHVGDILLGFAVLMFGMQTMSAAVAPLKESAEFINLLTSFSNPLLGILAGCLVTCVLQSASAAVGILQALAITGAIEFQMALPLIFGIAIGAAVPVLISAVGAGTSGKHTAFVYLLADVLGVIICSVLFYGLNAFLHFSFMTTIMTTVTVAALNTLFRFCTVVFLAPMIGLIEKLVKTLIRGKTENEKEMEEVDRLEDRFIAHPALAIEQSRVAVCSMARKACKNLFRSLDLLHQYSDADFQKIQDKEDIVDRYEDKLGTYLVKISQGELTHEMNKEMSKFLHTISDFERISDHAVNLSEVAQEMMQKKLEFSDEASHELEILEAAIREVTLLAENAFVQESIAFAVRVEPLEEVIDDLTNEMKRNHVQRIQRGECTLSHGFVFNDMLSNFERVADHCSNIAVAMIELESDAFDTHEYLNELKLNKDELFQKYLAEYREKYALSATTPVRVSRPADFLPAH